MKQEEIEAIRTAQKRREEFINQQKEDLNVWVSKNIDPLLKSCDHTYPWGEEAIVRDFSCNYISCRICGRQLPRYS